MKNSKIIEQILNLAHELEDRTNYSIKKLTKAIDLIQEINLEQEYKENEMRNYKKEINDFLKQYETNLKECLEAVYYGDICQLTDAVYQLFDISLEQITREGDSWIEGRYFSKKIGFEIVIDHEVLFSENEDDFINEMILLKGKAETIESKLKGLNDDN